MKNIVLFAAILIGFGLVGTKLASRMDAGSASVQVASTAPTPISSAANNTRASGPRIHTVNRNSRGQFHADGRVSGRSLSFMIDTGASVIALTAQDAARVGVRPMRADYDVNVSTANGTVKAARTRLSSVEIGGLTVYNVDALVLPEGALSENLLGMSFLNKLKRYEFAGSRLVLEQ